jgi:signal recognition particle subunit SEC65
LKTVENPLAREIVAACGRLRLETLFEPSKIHPKDWANPGRVKVRLKGGNNPTIKNSKNFSFPFFFHAASASVTQS